MKPHLQCAEQQLSPSSLTKYYTCHTERLTCLILIAYETSFTMRRATVVPLQPHQILRLSRTRLTCLILITYEIHLQCAEQQLSPSSLTKYYACHAARLTCLILITYETSFTMRGATVVPLQPHQIVCLSHRMTHMLYPRHI